jgi:hypothetical protein
MSQGRSIRLFLVDGTPNGLLTAEIMNWTGHVLTGPRSKLAELVQRPECGRTGVYSLAGPDSDDSLRTRVYIGESDDVAQRLRTHNRPEEQGGKDFWERVCLITSKDQNLTKAHAKYLESQLIQIATQTARCVLSNGTAHSYNNLPESDRADMAFFLEQIRIVLPVLGFEFLRELSKPSAPVSATAAAAPSHSPQFLLEVPRYRVSARGQEVDGEFFVLKGSNARSEWVGTERGYRGLYKQLIEEGVLVAGSGEHLTFSDDFAFSSPSAAAAVVCGRAANGRTSWVVEGSGQTYAAWQDQQLNAVDLTTAENTQEVV